MTTPFANEQLSAYLDGELTDTEASQLEAQLQADPVLRDELASLERAIGALREHAPAHAPEGFAQGVLAKLEHEPIPANTTAFWRRPFGIPLEGFAVAAVALMVFGVALNLGVTPEPPSEGAAVAKLDLSPQELPAKAAPPVMKQVAATDGEQAPDAMPEPPSSSWSSSRSATQSSRTAKPKQKSLAQELIGDIAEVTGGSASGPAGGEGLDYQAAEAPGEAAVAEDGGTDQSDARVAGYRYVLTTDDPEVAAALNRLAARYKGRLEDSSGKAVPGDRMAEADSANLRVHLPSSALRQFGDDLRSLGAVQQYSDNRWYTGEQVQVQLEVQMSRPVKYSPSKTSQSIERK